MKWWAEGGSYVRGWALINEGCRSWAVRYSGCLRCGNAWEGRWYISQSYKLSIQGGDDRKGVRATPEGDEIFLLIFLRRKTPAWIQLNFLLRSWLQNMRVSVNIIMHRLPTPHSGHLRDNLSLFKACFCHGQKLTNITKCSWTRIFLISTSCFYDSLRAWTLTSATCIHWGGNNHFSTSHFGGSTTLKNCSETIFPQVNLDASTLVWKM